MTHTARGFSSFAASSSSDEAPVGAVRDERLDRVRVDVVADAVVTVLEEPADDARAHSSEPDHSELHGGIRGHRSPLLGVVSRQHVPSAGHAVSSSSIRSPPTTQRSWISPASDLPSSCTASMTRASRRARERSSAAAWPDPEPSWFGSRRGSCLGARCRDRGTRRTTRTSVTVTGTTVRPNEARPRDQSPVLDPEPIAHAPSVGGHARDAVDVEVSAVLPRAFADGSSAAGIATIGPGTHFVLTSGSARVRFDQRASG